MPQTKPIVSIENVVASASVDQKIDLNVITQTFPDVEYHPDQFPGLVFRLRSPKTATLIFSSGKMVCTGAKSEKMAIPETQNARLADDEQRAGDEHRRAPRQGFRDTSRYSAREGFRGPGVVLPLEESFLGE